MSPPEQRCEAGCGRVKVLPGTDGKAVPWFARVRVKPRRYLYVYDAGSEPRVRIGTPGMVWMKREAARLGVAMGVRYDQRLTAIDAIVAHHLRCGAWRAGDEGLLREAVETLLATAELMGVVE